MKDDKVTYLNLVIADQRSAVEEIRALFPYAEDRACMAAQINAKCPIWLKDDFDYVCNVVVGEKPAVVIRGFMRAFIAANTKKPSS